MFKKGRQGNLLNLLENQKQHKKNKNLATLYKSSK